MLLGQRGGSLQVTVSVPRVTATGVQDPSLTEAPSLGDWEAVGPRWLAVGSYPALSSCRQWWSFSPDLGL